MVKDGLWLLFLRKGQAFIPTMARTEAGFYMGIEPVEVMCANDQKAVEDAMLRSVERGNPVVPTPTRDKYPADPLLKYAKVKSASIFEKSSQSWKLSKQGDAYLIAPYRPLKSGASEEDAERTEAFPVSAESLASVVHRLVERATRAMAVPR